MHRVLRIAARDGCNCCCVFMHAALHLLQLLGDSSSSTSAAVVQLRPSGCLAIPDVLLHVPLDTPQHPQQLCNTEPQQLSGLLLVGSKCSSSQVVGLLQSLVQAVASRHLVLEQQRQQDRAVVLPILQSALQPSLAGAQAVAVYQDPSGKSCFRHSGTIHEGVTYVTRLPVS
jgi:hypothetical protein